MLGMGLRDIGGDSRTDGSAEAVASEARRPRRRDVEPHRRGSNFGERAGICLRGGVVGSSFRGGHGSNHGPPILMFGVINRAANNEKEKRHPAFR